MKPISVVILFSYPKTKTQTKFQFFSTHAHHFLLSFFNGCLKHSGHFCLKKKRRGFGTQCCVRRVRRVRRVRALVAVVVALACLCFSMCLVGYPFTFQTRNRERSQLERKTLSPLVTYVLQKSCFFYQSFWVFANLYAFDFCAARFSSDPIHQVREKNWSCSFFYCIFYQWVELFLGGVRSRSIMLYGHFVTFLF